MEILAPAGNIQQATAGLNSGCDALYGGLRKWNARNRAVNFSLESYNWLVEQCHKYNRKFYLTLNTLLKDEEIEEIINLLCSGKLSMPDAIIAADIGFVIKLKSVLPQIPIHISTQFGAHSMLDLKFLESLNIQRVIFSRELKIKELESLCKKTKLETEVFIYGSQCVSFSGQCMWGSLVNGGSGNRGRCIGMCRDIYTHNNNTGQFMYLQDIKAFSKIEKLKEIGIDSIKIEGRMRSPEEISTAIINCSKINDNSDDYCGYLKEPFSYDGMINGVNPRTCFKTISCVNLKENDLIISKNSFIFAPKNEYEKTYDFVKSFFSNPLSDISPNIAIYPRIENFVLCGIDYINCYGERVLYKLDETENNEKISIEGLFKLFTTETDANIYEFSCKTPASVVISYNQKSIDRVLTKINKSLVQIPQKNDIKRSECEEKVFMTENTDRAVKALLDPTISKVIFDITNVTSLKKLRKIATNTQKIIFRLPVVNFAENEAEIYEEIRGCNVMITRISQLWLINEYGFKDVIADYTVNCWNSFTLKHMKDYGVSGLVLNPELSLKENLSLIENQGIKPFLIKYGRMNLGFTRTCFENIGLCSCDKKSFSLQNTFKDYKISINCYSDLDIRKIVYEKPFYCHCNIKGINNIYIEEFPDLKSTNNYAEIYNRSVN